MDRETDIRESRARGETVVSIAKRHGISRQRVHQLLNASTFPEGTSVHLQLVDVRGTTRDELAGWLRKQLKDAGIGTHRA